MRTIRVVDSHTGGEPTRVVLEGGPPLGDDGSVADRLEVFRARYDRYRSAIVSEPRGSDALVGALLCEPAEPGCAAGVIFFNNVGYLGMCGHGTIGLVVTLAHLDRLRPGVHRIETPVGVVTTEMHDDGRVTIANVPSYRWTAGATVDVPGRGRVTGDVAWGGNWFFLVHEPGIDVSLASIDALTDFGWKVRRALEAAGITGADRAEIDHIELLGPSRSGADGKSFVLCPGGAYDRSPCGTGTSATLACLHADGKLRPGDTWRQESVTGSVFEGRFAVDPQDPRRILPRITGTAHVTGEATLVLDDRDPLCWGIRETE